MASASDVRRWRATVGESIGGSAAQHDCASRGHPYYGTDPMGLNQLCPFCCTAGYRARPLYADRLPSDARNHRTALIRLGAHCIRTAERRWQRLPAAACATETVHSLWRTRDGLFGAYTVPTCGRPACGMRWSLHSLLRVRCTLHMAQHVARCIPVQHVASRRTVYDVAAL
jgi:hypothetical protein